MSQPPLSGSDLRRAVFSMISREMGPDVLVRYIAENFSQAGRNYTDERARAENRTLDEVIAKVEEHRRRHPDRPSGPA